MNKNLFFAIDFLIYREILSHLSKPWGWNMIRRQLFAVSLLVVKAAYADPITWIAAYPNNDMENAANWSPSSGSRSTDDAIFDSKIITLRQIHRKHERFSGFKFQFLT